VDNPNLNDENEPAKRMEAEGWYCRVRIQTRNKGGNNDTGDNWAHSGNNSLRFCSFDHEQKMDYRKDLDANTRYRYGVWFRNANYGDPCDFTIWNGNTKLWSRRIDAFKSWTYLEFDFTTNDTDKQLRMTTIRGGVYPDGTGWHNVYIDDMVLYKLNEPNDPLAGKTNLFANGDFEDETIDNSGNAYEWALASGNDNAAGDNFPVKYNADWGTYVRLQDIQKGSDTGLMWAHSGTKSLRFSYLADREPAQRFEGKSGDGVENDPDAWRLNLNLKKDLEPNKTYTFVFWLKVADYPDAGAFYVAVGDRKIWGGTLNQDYVTWTRQSVTFTTTVVNHEFRLYTELSGWFNFYLDDIFLYEEDTVTPFEGGEPYLFFGKSTGTESADVEIEYVAVDVTGAYPPGGVAIKDVNVAAVKNLNVYSANANLTFNALKPASVKVYTVAGALVAQLNVQKTESLTLPQGVYIVKSVAGGYTEVAKVINK
jgi:hypothetical protein